MSTFKYTAIIIEPRSHKALSFVLNNFLENLSEEWGFIIFHGNKNKDFINNILDGELNNYKNRIIKLINLNVDNLTNKEYNLILKSNSFYDNIDTEIFLIFQVDTLIIKENKELINNFLEYDYVGAPWINGLVGNGGLSLRKKSKMLKIIDKVDTNFKLNEDEYFSLQEEVSLYRPCFIEAQTFSVETVFHESPFGVHNCYHYLSEEHWLTLSNKYPDLNILKSLNTITKNEDEHPFTIIYKNDDDSLDTLKNSLLSLLQYVKLDNIYEIIIFIHNRINDETIELIEKIKLKHLIPCKIISLHYNLHGYFKQKIVACNSYEIVKTKYIAIFHCSNIFTKYLNLNDYLNEDNKIILQQLTQYDKNIKPFLFSKNSLKEASNYFKAKYNDTYEDYCQHKCREFNISVLNTLPEEYKYNIFNDEIFLLDFCKTQSDDFVKPIKKVIFVFTHKVCNHTTDDKYNFWGIGDIIRGLICVFQLSKKYNFKLIVDIQHHNLSKYLKIQNHELSEYIFNNRNNICFVDNPEKHIVNNNDDIMFFFTNGFYSEEITDECRNFIKNILVPNDEFKIYIDNQFEQYNSPAEYSIIHFRLGDDMLVRNQQKDLAYLKNIIELNYEKNDILISDSKEFKNFIKREYPDIFQYDIDIGHIGLDSHSKSIKDTLFELMLITKSQKIKTYSVYNHISGFVKIINEIYKIPLISI